MYRLLVVDDEEFITNGMAELLQGCRDMDLDVYKAYCGEEAIDWLRRTRMDVVLSDIHMVPKVKLPPAATLVCLLS